MSLRIFRWTFLPFLIALALVAGGACYQTVCVVPLWQQDISMFKNYGQWGIPYFPVLSPLMTVLWLVLLITGWKLKLPKKGIFYVGHFFFLLIMVSTFTYFAPFLLTHMGHPQNHISDQELSSQIGTWAKWDVVRQLIGLLALSLFLYTYSHLRAATASK